MINKQSISTKLQEISNASEGLYNPEDVVSLTLATGSLQETNVITIGTIADLPDLELNTGIPDGQVYFVTDNYIHVYSAGTKWVTFDGRTARDDTIPSLGYSWGRNSSSQLGDGTNVAKSTPTLIIGGITSWCQLSGSENVFALGLTSDGVIWGWGYNSLGQLGDGTSGTLLTRSSPVSVVGGFTDWCQVSAGGAHSLGLRTNGTAWAWGGSSGRLGDGTAVNRSSPVSVVGGFTDWCQVSAGNTHSLAVRTNGTVWAWGTGLNGILGDGTTVNQSSPVSVVGGFCDWCQVSAGGSHSLGVRTDGTAWAWGSGSSGRLGDGTTVNKSSPVSVVGGFTDWCQVSAGNIHSLGIRTNGTVWSWGGGSSGQLGDGTTVNQSSPVSVIGGFTDWCQVAGGENHSVGLRTNGTIWTWGYNGQGNLGDDTNVSKSSPVSVVGGFTDWCHVSAGRHTSFGIRKTI